MGTNRFESKLNLDQAALITVRAIKENRTTGPDLENFDHIEDQGELEQTYEDWVYEDWNGKTMSLEDHKIILVETGLSAMLYSEEDLDQEVLDAIEARQKRQRLHSA